MKEQIDSDTSMDRRVFLRCSCRAASCLIAAALAGTSLSGCGLKTNMEVMQAPITNGAYRLSLAAGAPLSKPGMAVFLEHPSIPIIAVQASPGVFRALSGLCTHEACNIVSYDPARGRFLCPCHNAQFDTNGEPKWGPPRRPLKSYVTRVEGDELVITVQ
ncbi:MAG: Rieske (2Fe-2S) protein [Candidatus Latescibacteria bacterium]|nr:Rieske (2Fe-2S) protein [Candidatus Latescibacterota bacterium]